MSFWVDPVAVGHDVTMFVDGPTYDDVFEPLLVEVGLHPTVDADNLQRSELMCIGRHDHVVHMCVCISLYVQMCMCVLEY